MIYYNQLDYPDMPYEHNLDEGGARKDRSNVAAAGCGPCCLCMVVGNMTMSELKLEDCLALSAEVKANRKRGTDLKILGPVVAEKFGLTYGATSSLDVLKDHLSRGGMAIANSGGDRDGYTGVFTHGGHYILVLSIDGDEACILDPSYKDGKYDEPGREGKATMSGGFVYCHTDVLVKDCENRTPSFHLFARKH